MRKILHPVFLALFALIAISCDNEPLEGDFVDSSGGSDTSTTSGSFEAIVDGNSFVAVGAIAITLYNEDMVQTSINGANLSGNSIGIQFSAADTGTYVISQPEDFDNPGDGYALYGELATQSMPYVTTVDAPGTLEITKYDTDNLLISGTFSFQAEREIENEDGTTSVELISITEGKFTDIELQIQD